MELIGLLDSLGIKFSDEQSIDNVEEWEDVDDSDDDMEMS